MKNKIGSSTTNKQPIMNIEHTLYDILRANILPENPTTLQIDILFDIIRNVNQIDIINMIQDIQVSITQQQRPRVRTRQLRIQQQQQPTYITKTMSLKKSLIEQEEECAICQDVHKKIETTMIKDCSHCFGTECLQRWTDICWTRDKKRASCPSCRTEMKDCVTYRARKTPTKKNKYIPV